MKVIIPLSVTDETLTACNIAEDDHAVWSGAVTYARGEFVISTDTHTVYRSLTDGNVGNDPDLELVALADPLVEDPDPVNWQVIGATNRWRLFDEKPSQPAVQVSSITFEFEPGQIVQGIAGFRIDASEVRVRVYDADSLVYDKTIPMQDSSAVIDWLTYYTAPLDASTEFVLTDLPVLGSPRIVFEATGPNVKIGQVVVGEVWTLGRAIVDGSGFSGLDFSSVETDQFGNLSTVRRDAARLFDFNTAVPANLLQNFAKKMDGLRGGLPAVWIASENPLFAAIAYGFARNYSAPYRSALFSVVSIEVQGIV